MDNIAELMRHVAAAATMYADHLEAEAEAEAEPPKTRGKKTKPAAEPEAEAEPPKRGKGKKAKARTMEDVKDALVELSEAADKQAVKDVLSRFGVTKLGDLAEENYAEAFDAAKEATAEANADGEGDEGDDDPF